MDLIPLYNQWHVKQAGNIQRAINVYESMKDKLPGDKPSVPGQAAVGGVTGAGIGGMGAIVGSGFNRAVAKDPQLMQWMQQAHPWASKLLGGMGRRSLATVAIPAGILALISGIRAQRKQ